MTYQEFLELIQKPGDLTNNTPVYTSDDLHENLNSFVDRLAHDSRGGIIKLERLNLSQFSTKAAAEILFGLKTYQFFEHQTSLSTIIMPKKPKRNFYRGRGLFDKDRVSYALHQQSASGKSLVQEIGNTIFDTTVMSVEGLEHVKPHSKRFLQMICWYNQLKEIVSQNRSSSGSPENALCITLGNFLGEYDLNSYSRHLRMIPLTFQYPEFMQYQQIATIYKMLGLGEMQKGSYAGDPQRHAIYMNALDQVYNEVESRMAALHPYKSEIDVVNAAMQVSFKP